MSAFPQPFGAAWVIWDFVGTLARPAEPVGETYARAAADHGIVADPAGVDKRLRASFARAEPPAFGHLSPRRRPVAVRQWWRVRMADAFAMPLGALPERLFEQLYDHYARPSAWHLLPGVLAVTRALRSRAVRQIVLSNGDERFAVLVPGLGLPIEAEDVVTSEELLAAKPDRLAFESVLALFGAEADRTALVDDVAANRRAAAALGMTVFADAAAVAVALGLDSGL